jgi:hypothetical protein
MNRKKSDKTEGAKIKAENEQIESDVQELVNSNHEVAKPNENEPSTAPPVPSSELSPDIATNGIDAESEEKELDPVPDDSGNTAEKTEPDEDTDKAVDDIVAKEGDDLLAAEDEKLAGAFQPGQKPRLIQKLKNLLAAWWHNKKARWATIIAAGVILLGISFWPTSRYFALNSAGVRASASIQVLDDSTQQPLKNVQVSLANQIAKTGDDGRANLKHIKLGKTKLLIKKRAFASLAKNVTVGWGSNPMDTVRVTPTGTQYIFTVSDFLSGKALDKAEAISGEANAQADSTGKIVLTIDGATDQPIGVTLSAPNYRDEKLTIGQDDKSSRSIKMVPARKHVFVSKRSGKYDVYSIDADSQNAKVIFKATGHERDDITLISHPTANMVALVSTRDNAHNSDGYLLSNLYLINPDTGEVANLGQSEKIQIIGWVADRLIYVQVQAGASAANPNRERLVSYDYKDNKKYELASNNYFNYVAVAGSSVYYAPSGGYQPQNANVYKISPDGASRQTILNKEVWDIFRTEFDHLSLSSQQGWYDYKLGDSQAAKVSGAPASLQDRLYSDRADHKKSLWVDQRDGKGVLLERDTKDGVDKVLKSQSGLANPVYWLNDNYVVYRIQTDQETADYLLNLDGGQPRKISDVSATKYTGGWHY